MIVRGKQNSDELEAAYRHGYPRPQLVRQDWWSLNGPWEFAIDVEGVWRLPQQVRWQTQIQVPFSPETPASGVGDTGLYRAVWYRRVVNTPALQDGQRLLLHFGAVDYHAVVWVNEVAVCEHEGGYTPFCCDITEYLRRDGRQTVVVRAEDDPHDLAKPRGKQDWQLEPHAIWYPRTTGIWQTVWMERVPCAWIDRLRWNSSLAHWEIELNAKVEGDCRAGMHLRVRLEVENQIIAEDSYAVIAGEVARRIALSDPGIDDYRNELLWYPSTPRLINAIVELRDANGGVIDSVRSYTALRAIGIQGDRVVLNGRPYYLRMVLDQGYFPQTGLSTPDDNALRRDVQMVKAMGFNGVRRHQTVSDPRFLYWADTLGLLVWEEMPSAYRFTTRSITRLFREWMDVMQRDISHPSIITWVPLNESWGVPDLPDSPSQRHFVQSLYHLTKTLDPTRPVVGNDGWESVATDVIGVHDYDDQPERIAQRYGTEELTKLFNRERPGGRMLVIDQEAHGAQPIVLSEFGGIAMSRDVGSTWGYSRARDGRELAQRYQSLMAVVHSLPMLAGFCYTQFADTYQEANGLLFDDRTPKFPLEAMATATGGSHLARDLQFQYDWRERMMRQQMYHYSIPSEDHRTNSH